MDSLEGLNEAVVNAIATGNNSRWLEELRKNIHFEQVIKMVEKKEEGVIKLPGEKSPLRAIDFAIDERNRGRKSRVCGSRGT